MEAADLPVLLASGLTAGPQEPFPLDRVRMQKAIFLITQRGSDQLRTLYSYRPYNWGPYSDDLAQDVRMLQAQGKLAVVDHGASRYGQYVATPAGEVEAQRVWGQLTPAEQSFVSAVRAYVTASSFRKLLREVYAEYPAYATASHFRD